MKRGSSKSMSKRVADDGITSVERIFNDVQGVSFEAILSQLVDDNIAKNVSSSYHHEQVNVATSDKGVA